MPRGEIVLVRVTILCADLSNNGLSRAYLLAEILERDFEVDVAGTTFGDGIWPPGDTGRFRYAAVPGARWPRYGRSLPRLLRAITGDVVYAMKPLPTSLGIALLHRRLHGAPVVLDIDDDDLSFIPPMRRAKSIAAGVLYPNGRLWAQAAIRAVGAADAITVASTGLEARFGGVLVPHARDTDRLHPRPERAGAAKDRLGLAGRPLVMFLGTPRPHKGIEDAAIAIRMMRRDVRFAVVGADARDPYTQLLRDSFGEIHFVPPYGLDDVPLLLEAADAVVVPQRAQPEAALQLPIKLFDAMAMARPIVATAVADIPAILGNGRGHVVPPGDAAAMARALDTIFDAPDRAAEMGALARRWCVAHASYESARAVLAPVVAAAARRRRGVTA